MILDVTIWYKGEGSLMFVGPKPWRALAEDELSERHFESETPEDPVIVVGAPNQAMDLSEKERLNLHNDVC